VASPAGLARPPVRGDGCEQCEITVFERGPHASFANCGLPYFVGGEIVKPADLLVQTPESLRARFNLDVRANCEVTGIDRAERLVKVRERISGREYEQPYDPGIEREGHFTGEQHSRCGAY
jgi:NADPH-dependent 2,4-dienoyl-CoA reductase/sulfur reductase-like enzyme